MAIYTQMGNQVTILNRIDREMVTVEYQDGTGQAIKPLWSLKADGGSQEIHDAIDQLA